MGPESSKCNMESVEHIALLSNDEKIVSKDESSKKALDNFWKRVALVLLITSVIVQLGLGASIIVFALKERTPGGLGLGIDIILDVLTTLVVIWRYICKKNERNACILIAILFIISGIALNIKAVYNLSKEWLPYFKPYILLPIESTILVTFGILMIGKIYVSKKLKSKSLFVDGINTGCGVILAVMNLASIIVYKKTNLWFLDSVSAVIMSVFFFLFGVRLLLTSINQEGKSNSND